MNIDAIDANVVQLMVRVAGKLLQCGPIGEASAKETCEKEYLSERLHCVILNRE